MKTVDGVTGKKSCKELKKKKLCDDTFVAKKCPVCKTCNE